MSEQKLVSKNARKLQNSQWLGIMLPLRQYRWKVGSVVLHIQLKLNSQLLSPKREAGGSLELMAVGASELGHHPLPVVRMKRLGLRLAVE